MNQAEKRRRAVVYALGLLVVLATWLLTAPLKSGALGAAEAAKTAAFAKCEHNKTLCLGAFVKFTDDWVFQIKTYDDYIYVVEHEPLVSYVALPGEAAWYQLRDKHADEFVYHP